MTEDEIRERRQRYYASRTPEQKAAYRLKAREGAAARREAHIAERAERGLAPRQKTPSKTAEELAAIRLAKAERRRERRLADLEVEREKDRIKARRLAAQKAGLPVPVDIDRPKAPLLTEEEKRERRRVKSAAWRAENRERAREIGRESMKRAAAERAVAEGREPGKKGRPAYLTPEEKRAKRKALTVAHTMAHLAEVREKARIREQAKRDGTFVSRALPRLTDEQRRQVGVVMSANRRARLRGNGGTYTRGDIENIMQQQDGLCLFCGDALGFELPHVDHWIPIVRGGLNEPDNLALLHQSCNLRKGARLPSEFGLPDSPIPLRAALQQTALPEEVGSPDPLSSLKGD